MKEKLIEWRKQTGQAISLGETVVTPQSQALIIRLPFWGMVWNRPVGISVERDGSVEKYPIVDVTRSAMFFLALAGFLATLLGWLARQRADRGKR